MTLRQADIFLKNLFDRQLQKRHVFREPSCHVLQSGNQTSSENKHVQSMQCNQEDNHPGRQEQTNRYCEGYKNNMKPKKESIDNILSIGIHNFTITQK